MSTDGVYQNDMPSLPDDQWPADDPALASFAEDLRIIAAGPAPEPRPGLVAAMSQGAVPFESPTAGRTKRMLTKTIIGGLAAKLAMGVGVAAASVTLAGATGMLPEPAQEVVASVVAAATPFELPDPGVNLQVGDPSSSTSSTSTSVAGNDDDEGTEGTAERKVNHGLCVSTAAKDKVATEGADPNAHGKTVSSIARSDCGKEDKEKGTSSSTTSTTVGSSSTSSTSSTSTTVASSNSRSANSGPGNSGNNGKGNSGKN